jgi:hypothetical protein
MPLYPEEGEGQLLAGQGKAEVTPGMGMALDQEPEVLIIMGMETGDRDEEQEVTMET